MNGVHLDVLKKSKKLRELWLATFNTSCGWGTRDGSRKAATLCLIPKATKELDTPLNGRTISLLQTASKMEGELTEQRLCEAVPQENVAKRQHAFVKNGSCETAPTKLERRRKQSKTEHVMKNLQPLCCSQVPLKLIQKPGILARCANCVMNVERGDLHRCGSTTGSEIALQGSDSATPSLNT